VQGFRFKTRLQGIIIREKESVEGEILDTQG